MSIKLKYDFSVLQLSALEERCYLQGLYERGTTPDAMPRAERSTSRIQKLKSTTDRIPISIATRPS